MVLCFRLDLHPLSTGHWPTVFRRAPLETNSPVFQALEDLISRKWPTFGSKYVRSLPSLFYHVSTWLPCVKCRRCPAFRKAPKARTEISAMPAKLSGFYGITSCLVSHFYNPHNGYTIRVWDVYKVIYLLGHLTLISPCTTESQYTAQRRHPIWHCSCVCASFTYPNQNHYLVSNHFLIQFALPRLFLILGC